MFRSSHRREVVFLAYLRDKDNELRTKDEEIRNLRNRIDELTRELHAREIEIVELKKESHPVEKSAVAAASTKRVG